ncbi:uncharacterized protein LOC130621270 [Hydractinia symbiolongicarpus]|uniref:uncharacterized protein LOC130621270 n=1 Tax=Hydractinia symbiolongicarpus TaxID=13093 RepID=UPI00254ADB09|nr:uncharacterized protein LOC130621270 [Hydractinia symbiolongicarpus]
MEENKRCPNCKKVLALDAFRHEKRKAQCKECRGSQICEHEKLRHRCKECKKSKHLEGTRCCPNCKNSLLPDAFRVVKNGQTWDNYGKGWHFDHKILFRYKESGYAPSLHEVGRRLHYTNTQPMWASENIAKGNRYVSE